MSPHNPHNPLTCSPGAGSRSRKNSVNPHNLPAAEVLRGCAGVLRGCARTGPRGLDLDVRGFCGFCGLCGAQIQEDPAA